MAFIVIEFTIIVKETEIHRCVCVCVCVQAYPPFWGPHFSTRIVKLAIFSPHEGKIIKILNDVYPKCNV